MADGRRLKVLDFGLAKLWTPSDPQDTRSPTLSQSSPGQLVGTVGYMSPEQVAGSALDARSDIFSLGCVLYEMVSGRRAFGRKTTPETMVAILNEEPLEVAEAPVDLRRLIGHCLEKDREARFQSARDLAFALREVLGSGASAGAPASAGGVKTLAVLPFENLGGSDDACFTEGMADEVRGKLAALPALQVIARGSSNEYRGTTKTQKQIASELGVSHLLSATVRWEKRAGAVSRVRVSPELVEVAEGPAPTTRWHRVFDAVLDDVFQVQAEIAEQVAAALEVALGEVGRRHVVVGPPGMSLPTRRPPRQRRDGLVREHLGPGPQAGHRGIRPGCRARRGVRPGVGSALPGLLGAVLQRHPGFVPPGASGGGSGAGARARRRATHRPPRPGRLLLERLRLAPGSRAVRRRLAGGATRCRPARRPAPRLSSGRGAGRNLSPRSARRRTSTAARPRRRAA